ncbi:MAG: hypothetical protein QNJ54_37730 [Prochloraceae cyanobacterium]|nr:hypothetical protein [Prochloraceae cyanobacterium]
MIQNIKLNSHVASDGILRLEVPLAITDADVQVTISIVSATPNNRKTPEELGWPQDFFERTAGALEQDPLLRYPQGELPQKDWDDLSA